MGTTEAIEHKSEPDTDGRWASAQGIPPSAKLVVEILDYEGTLTWSQIAEGSFLSPRTVRYVLSRLEDEDAVGSRFLFPDMRKRLYALSI